MSFKPSNVREQIFFRPGAVGLRQNPNAFGILLIIRKDEQVMILVMMSWSTTFCTQLDQTIFVLVMSLDDLCSDTLEFIALTFLTVKCLLLGLANLFLELLEIPGLD